MNRLLAIGFQFAGYWQWSDDRLVCKLDRFATANNILYAFVSDGEVKYVGKTVRSLQRRMSGYERPTATQSTNLRLHALISECLRSASAVDILALPDNGLLHYGPFHVNLAAGLEDDVIAVLRPSWNGAPKPDRLETSEAGESPLMTHQFEFTLQPTYFKTGFFNVPIADSRWLGDHGQEIEVYCGSTAQTITGVINRTANANHSPRILGGADLRNWFESQLTVMDQVRVLVHSPVSIRLIPSRTTGE